VVSPDGGRAGVGLRIALLAQFGGKRASGLVRGDLGRRAPGLDPAQTLRGAGEAERFQMPPRAADPVGLTVPAEAIHLSVGTIEKRLEQARRPLRQQHSPLSPPRGHGPEGEFFLCRIN
jgi:hypothetical protein